MPTIICVQFMVNGEVKRSKTFLKGERYARVHLDLHLLLMQLLLDLAEDGKIVREGR